MDLCTINRTTRCTVYCVLSAVILLSNRWRFIRLNKRCPILDGFLFNKKMSQDKDLLSRRSMRRSFSVQKLSFGRRASKQLKLVRTYQPTYQLNSRNCFNAENVQKILKRIVDSELEEAEYSEKVVPELCTTLAEMIRSAVKEEKYDRYRILVSVSIGQRRNQGVHIFHSFLWDNERDGFASHNYENCHLFANVAVYGVYLD